MIARPASASHNAVAAIQPPGKPSSPVIAPLVNMSTARRRGTAAAAGPSVTSRATPSRIRSAGRGQSLSGGSALLRRQAHHDPVCHQRFPDELYQAPRSWAERAYPGNLIHYDRLDRGGHFAAWEQPYLFAAEMRVAFRTLR